MQEVKGRSLLAYDLPIEVPNYPLYPRTEEESRLLNQAKSRRRIEIAVGAFYRKEYEKIYKKTSSSVRHNVGVVLLVAHFFRSKPTYLFFILQNWFWTFGRSFGSAISYLLLMWAKVTCVS